MKNLQHTLFALLFQFIGFLLTHSTIPGAIFAIAFFMGRELAQAENRYVIRHYGSSNRPKEMRWWKALTPEVWSVDSFIWDLIIPILITSIIAYWI